MQHQAHDKLAGLPPEAEESGPGGPTSWRMRVAVALPPVLVAISLNGFFVYLAVLDLIDVTPATRTTAAYYGLLCVSLLVAGWRGRRMLGTRISHPRRAVALFMYSSALLAGWFLINTAVLADGRLAYRLAGLLVLWTIPTAVVAASLRRPQLQEVALALVALALLFVAIEALVLLRTGTHVFRFTPIAGLDPISAGIIPAVGAIAMMSLRTQTTRARIAQGAIIVVLVAASVIPGSRGPVLTLAIGGVTLALMQGRRAAAIAIGCLAVGFTVGSVAGAHIGSYGYLTSDTVGGIASVGPPPSTNNQPAEKISTFSIRREWLETAVRAIPHKPLFGHGVGMLVDDTPEARRMGVAGQHTYPHNTLVEAAYSLGAIGLAAYVAVLGAAAVALSFLVRSNRRDPAILFTLGIAVFAFVNANISGEIGEDALLWSAAAVAVALYADARAATASAR